jgi:uncharacterized protein (TIGR02391 family)
VSTELTTDQQALLSEIYDVFRTEGSWPVHLYLDTRLDQKHDLLVDDVLATIPDDLLRVPTHPRENSEIKLRIAGMLHCEGADADIALFIRALQWCVAKRAAFQLDSPTVVEQLRPSTDEATAEWAEEGYVTTPLDLTKLNAMFDAESIDVSLNGSPGDWTWDIHKSIRRFRGVRNVYSYLDLINGQPPAQQTANPMVAPGPTIIMHPPQQVRVVGGVAADADPAISLTLDGLHPLVRDACAQLFAGKHLRQGVLEAVLVLRDLVRERSGLTDSDDSKLMGKALGGNNPKIVIADLSTETGRNIQRGTSHLAQGVVARVRNVLAHESVELEPVEAMEMVGLVSRVVRDVDGASEVASHANND